MRLPVFSVSLAALLFGAAACDSGGPCAASVVVTTEGGLPRLAVCADLAQTPEERRRGLLGRTSLDDGEGLLIWFPLEGEACITGANMAFAIDVLFVSGATPKGAHSQGTVAFVERFGADDERVVCHDGVRAALEVPSGAASLVLSGDRLVLSRSPE